MRLIDQIKADVTRSGKSVYQLAYATQIAEKSLRGFMAGKAGLSQFALERLVAHLGLALLKVDSPSVPDRVR